MEESRQNKVTPCVGVWIEMAKLDCCSSCIASLPAWECVLKFAYFIAIFNRIIVTPCVGVWIEMSAASSKMALVAVTPCVGVWIEIIPSTGTYWRAGSLPAWECGLKFKRTKGIKEP